MSTAMTIKITEDDAPDGYVEVDYDIDGFDIETAQTNGDLPPALILGAEMLKLLDELEREGKLKSGGGRPAPARNASTPTRRRVRRNSGR